MEQAQSGSADSPTSSDPRTMWHRSLGQIPEPEGVVGNSDPGGAEDEHAKSTSLIKRDC